MNKFMIATLLVILLPSMTYSEETYQDDEHTKVAGIEALSPDLRRLLSEEMRALQDGMMSIIPAYNSGNWDEIVITAEKMKNSYILKQNLTDSQAEELHSALSAEFIEKDQRFHYLAGMLGHAAQNKKAELINFYFSEMNESCAGCHAAFATHKFPALKQSENGEHVH